MNKFVAEMLEPDKQKLEKLLSACYSKTRFGKTLNLFLNSLFFARSSAIICAKKIFATLGIKANLSDDEKPSLQALAITEYGWQEVQSPSFNLKNIGNNRKNLRVLIVADLGLEQCRTYRVDQKLELLRLSGTEAKVFSFQNLDEVWESLYFASHIIFYRVPGTQAILELSQAAKALNISTIFEADDLVFDVRQYSMHPYFKSCSKREKRLALKNSEQMQRLLRTCVHAIGSTPSLVDKLGAIVSGRTYLLRNQMEKGLLELQRLNSNYAKFKLTRENIFIGYASGSKSHDHDLEEISEAIAMILSEFSGVRLVIFGPVTIPRRFEKFRSQIITIEKADRGNFYQLLALLDINLAPLVDDPFNEAKSNIKYLEAAALRVPTVASSRTEFRNFIANGQNGFIADTAHEWYEALKLLIINPSKRIEFGIAAEQCIVESFSLNATLANEFKDWLISIQADCGNSAYTNRTIENDQCSPQPVNSPVYIIKEKKIEGLTRPFLFSGQEEKNEVCLFHSGLLPMATLEPLLVDFLKFTRPRTVITTAPSALLATLMKIKESERLPINFDTLQNILTHDLPYRSADHFSKQMATEMFNRFFCMNDLYSKDNCKT